MDVLFQANLTQTLQPNYLSRNILTVFMSYSHTYKLLCHISYVLYKSTLMSYIRPIITLSIEWLLRYFKDTSKGAT